MTEQEYTDAIECYVREWTNMPDEARWLVDRAVLAFPASAMIWLLHGKVYSRSQDFDDFPETVSLKSFERAAELNPNLAEAHHEIACYYDGVNDDPEKAEPFFRRAAELRLQESTVKFV